MFYLFHCNISRDVCEGLPSLVLPAVRSSLRAGFVKSCCECAMVCRPCLLCNFCVYECKISALIFVVRGMYGYYFLLGVVLGILLGEVDELEPAIHTLLTCNSDSIRVVDVAVWVQLD